MSIGITHPTLGSITGIDQDTTVAFRGIPYATLENRFAEAQLFTNSSKQPVDGTKWGPTTIISPQACDNEHGFIQKALPHGEFTYSDTKGLNLNIVCPKTTKQNLPVFVFVHGGGFAHGSNSWPHYDPTGLVRLSLDSDTPVIGININYRLGPFGFLTSPALREAGFKPNNGLRDQQTAFRWIKKNIEAFGGDPDNVTALAESVGGVSVLLHLQSQEPLFHNVMSMAGTPLLMGPLPMAVIDSMYPAILKSLGITATSPKEQIDALLSMPTDKLLSGIPPGTPLIPVLDNDIITSSASFNQWTTPEGRAQASKGWCKRLFIGECQFDSNILSYTLPPPRMENIGEKFKTSLSHTLPSHPDVQKDLLEAYSIPDPDSRLDVEHVLEFAHDIGFYATAVTIASNWSGDAFVYHFNELNPWEGLWKGKSTHVLDIAFLLQNYNDHLSEEQKHSARRFGEDVIEFLYGRDPFPRYTVEKPGAMVYGLGKAGNVEFVQSEKAEDYGRRSHVFELAKRATLDELAGVWSGFMAGR